jgi:hypothetical protein
MVSAMTDHGGAIRKQGMPYFVSEREAGASRRAQGIELDTKDTTIPPDSCVHNRGIWNDLNPQ